MKKPLLLLFLIVMSLSVQGQKKTVTGKVVTKESQIALCGVLVSVRGTDFCCATDSSGHYSMSVPEKTRFLVFTLSGYKNAEAELKDGSATDVIMEEDPARTDISVAGAPWIPRCNGELGWPVQTVSGGMIDDSRTVFVSDALVGSMAGLNVWGLSSLSGSGTSLTLRGPRSIHGHQQPLLIVDGVPYDASQYTSGDPELGTNHLFSGVQYSDRFTDLNPGDIRSMSVLRGGAASALYGVRGANGAILITTGNGSMEEGQDRYYHVDFTSSVSIDKVSRLPSMQRSYGQGSDGIWMGPETTARDSWGPRLDTCSYTHTGLNPAQDADGNGQYDWDGNGIIVSANDSRASGAPAEPYEESREFFETGYAYYNALKVSGGQRQNSYLMSFSNLHSDGVVPNSTYDRTTAKLSGTQQLTERLRAGGSATYVNAGGKRIRQGADLSGVMHALMLTPPGFDNSNGYSDPVNTPLAYMWTEGPLTGLQRSYRAYGIYDNPYWTVNQNHFRDEVNRLSGYLSLAYTAAEWIQFSYRLGADIYSDRRKAFLAIHSSAQPGGQVMEDLHQKSGFNGDLLIHIQRKLSRDIGIEVNMGHNIFQIAHSQVYAQGDELLVPDIENLSNATVLLVREKQSRYRSSAYFGELSLAWRDILIMNTGGRYEKPSSLSKGFFFPSVSAAFILTEIGGLKSNKTFPFGKIRVSYARTGNLPPAYIRYVPHIQGPYSEGWTTGVYYPYGEYNAYAGGDESSNYRLGPEYTNCTEAGADLRFISNRLSLDFTYYFSRSFDLLINVPVAGPSGYTDQWLNSATVSNRGYEILFHAVPVKSKNNKISWDLGLVFSQNRNRVESLAEGVESVLLSSIMGVEVRAERGKPWGSIYGTSWQRDAEGRLVINDDPSDPDYGRPLPAAGKTFLGSVLPDWTMGISSGFEFSGLRLSVLFDIKKGGVRWNGTRGVMTATGTHANTENRGETVVFEGVTGHYDGSGQLVISGGTNTVETSLDQSWYQHLGGGFEGPAEQFIEDADRISLREVSLSYSFDNKWLSKSFFRSFELFFSGRNLWVWTPYSGSDPGSSLMGSYAVQGLDYFNMPGSRTYTVGLRCRL